jgi:hypothetical protein
MRRPFAQLTVAVALAAAGLPAASASAEEWRPFPLPVPPGGQLATPPGRPLELSFWTPNRGLMQVAGNASVSPGLYSFDGRAWHQLATVCGATGTQGGIAWAGPTEFWTISDASPGVASSGALCHFRDGAVVGSHGAPNVPGFRAAGNAAACLSAADCWFGGNQYESPDGSRIGAFHLHWDGGALTPVYAPQGRAVSDLLAHAGRIHESVFVGPAPGVASAPVLSEPEAVPALLHRIDGGLFGNDPWTPSPLDGVPDDGTELRALDSDGATAWAVGGGARSGPAAAGGNVARTPVAARLDGDGWSDLRVHGDGIGLGEVFGDVAAVPGTQTAWATLVDDSDGSRGQPRVAFIAADGALAVQQLAGDNDPLRGGAAQVDCPSATDCWLATARGYLYRLGGEAYPPDEDPAFQGTITERPNEGAAQFVPDTPPQDDSRLFAPPVELPPIDSEPPPTCRRPPRLMAGVRAPRVTRVPGQARGARDPRFRLEIRFRLARRAKVALIAERRTRAAADRRGADRRAATRRATTRVVARTRLRTLGAGPRSAVVIVRRTTWPTRLRFVVRETTRARCVEASSSTADAPR